MVVILEVGERAVMRVDSLRVRALPLASCDEIPNEVDEDEEEGREEEREEE